ncbi:hypothetical protein HDU86_007665 [Geranomyces michiganensis]|nr:hypothetical protein HDU86_007665 [Geranomyces michiganensis]
MPPRPFGIQAARLRPPCVHRPSTLAVTITATANPRRATFFSLPNLPDLLPSAPTALLRKEHSQRHTLPYSPRQLYALVADVEQYHRFVPWCTRSRVLENKKLTRNDDGGGGAERTIMRAELGIGFRALSETYVSRVEAVEGVSVTALAQDSSVFKQLNTTWRFSPAGTGRTNLPNSTQTPTATTTTHSSPPSLLRSSASPSISPAQRNPIPPPSSLDSPSCIVDFHILFEFRSPLYAHVSTLFFEEVSKAMMGAFEDRARVVYGPPPFIGGAGVQRE